MALQTMAYVSFHFVGATNPTYQPKQTSVDAAFMRSPIKTFEICERQSANLRNRSISQRQGYRRIISGSPSTSHQHTQLELTKIHCNVYFKWTNYIKSKSFKQVPEIAGTSGPLDWCWPTWWGGGVPCTVGRSCSWTSLFRFDRQRALYRRLETKMEPVRCLSWRPRCLSTGRELRAAKCEPLFPINTTTAGATADRWPSVPTACRSA